MTINMLDIPTKPMRLYSTSSLLSIEPNFVFLAPSLLSLFNDSYIYLFFRWHALLASRIINYMHKLANSASNGAVNMEFGSLYSGNDGAHNGVRFVVITKYLIDNIFVIQDKITIENGTI